MLGGGGHTKSAAKALSGTGYLCLTIHDDDVMCKIIKVIVKRVPLSPFRGDVLLSVLKRYTLTLRGRGGTHRGRRTTILTGGRRLQTGLLHTVSRSLEAPLASVSNGTDGLLSGNSSFSGSAGGRLCASVCSSSV